MRNDAHHPAAHGHGVPNVQCYQVCGRDVVSHGSVRITAQRDSGVNPNNQFESMLSILNKFVQTWDDIWTQTSLLAAQGL